MIDFPHLDLDIKTVLFFNQFCGKSTFWDTLLLIFLSVDAIRTAILVALTVGIWEFGRAKKNIQARKRVIAILFSIVLSLGIIEIMNAVIDSKRPIVTYETQIKEPIRSYNTKQLWKDGWVRNAKHGSFPSDTVALLGTIACGLFFWRRSIGIIAFLFVLFGGMIPRLYFGLHYPSDMLIGVLIAVLATFVVEKLKFLDILSNSLINIYDKYPYIFGTLGFYLMYIIADKFILLRQLPLWIKAMFQ